MVHDVFISYSSKDQKIVEGVSHFLEQNGIRCFVAYRDIPPGVVWAKAITEAIENCKLMVIVFSEHFNRSDQVDREIEMCSDEKKFIIPFRIQDADFSGAKKYYLKNINWIDAFPNPEECFGELLKSIQRILPVSTVDNTPAKEIVEEVNVVEEPIKTTSTEIEDINEITRRFEKILKEALEKAFKEKFSNPDDYGIESEELEFPSIWINNHDWYKDDFYIGIYYEHSSKLYLRIHGANDNDYRDMYIKMRQEWGGNFNKYNWWMRLEEPYNSWVHTDEGRKAFSNPDEKMLSYFCDLFTRSIEYYANYHKVITLRDKLSEELKSENISESFFKDALTVSIWSNDCLVHNYYFDDNGVDKTIVINTYITMEDDGNRWATKFFIQEDNHEKTKELFPEVFEVFKDARIVNDFGEIGKYIIKSYPLDIDLSIIAKDLKELREMIEKQIKIYYANNII